MSIFSNRILTEGTPWKRILVFAMPVFLGILFQQLYNTADSIIVGNFESQDALAAVGTTNSFGLLFLSFANGFSAGAGIIAAQLFGANRQSELRKKSITAIILILAMGVAATVIGYFLCEPVFKYVLSVSENLIGMSVSYFKIYSLGLIFQFGYNIISALLRAIGDSKSSLLFLLIASVINVVLDILFVAKWRMGVAGAAAATGIAQACSCFAAFIYMYVKYPVYNYRVKDITFSYDDAGIILHAGFPMALQQIIVSLGATFIQRAVNSYGDAMTTSFAVAQKVEQYLHMPTTAFQITMATFAGQNFGAGKIDRVVKGGKQGVLLSVLSSLVASVFSFIFAEQICSIFAVSGLAAEYCVQHIRTISVLFLILAAYFPLFGVLQGVGNGFAPTVVAVIALSIRVIVTYTLCYLPVFGYTIVWWNPLFGFGCGCLLTWFHFLRGKWKKI